MSCALAQFRLKGKGLNWDASIFRLNCWTYVFRLSLKILKFVFQCRFEPWKRSTLNITTSDCIINSVTCKPFKMVGKYAICVNSLRTTEYSRCLRPRNNERYLVWKTPVGSIVRMNIPYFQNPLGIKKSLGKTKGCTLLIELSSLEHLIATSP